MSIILSPRGECKDCDEKCQSFDGQATSTQSKCGFCPHMYGRHIPIPSGSAAPSTVSLDVLHQKLAESEAKQAASLARGIEELKLHSTLSPAGSSLITNALQPMSRRQTTEYWKNIMEIARVDIALFQHIFNIHPSSFSFSTSIASSSVPLSANSTPPPDPPLSSRVPVLFHKLQHHSRWTQPIEISNLSTQSSKKTAKTNTTLLQQLQQPVDEHDIQQVMGFVHEICCVNSSLVLRDTSNGSCAPLQPHHKFDHCAVPVSSSSSTSSARVSWYDIVFPEQLKRSLLDSDSIKEARLQLADDMSEILDKQPERTFVIGFISDGVWIQFYHFSADPFSVTTTGLIKFLHFPSLLSSSSTSSVQPDVSPIPSGFALYAAMMMCTPLQLGHPATILPTLPSSVFTSSDIKSSQPAIVIRRGDDHKPNVFEVMMNDGRAAIVKCYPRPFSFARESEALMQLDMSLPTLPIPRILFNIDKPDLHCLVIRPVATYSLIDAPFSVSLFANAVLAGWQVLDGLHRNGLIHGDVTPSNCLVIPAQDEKTIEYENDTDSASASSLSPFLCLINDFGCSGRADAPAYRFIGTHDYAAPAWSTIIFDPDCNEPVKRTPLNDYCSLLFTLIFFGDTSDSRRLPWSRESNVTTMWIKKLNLLIGNQRESLLSRVRPIVKPFLRGLAACLLDQSDVTAAVKLLKQHSNIQAYRMNSITE